MIHPRAHFPIGQMSRNEDKWEEEGKTDSDEEKTNEPNGYMKSQPKVEGVSATLKDLF